MGIPNSFLRYQWAVALELMSMRIDAGPPDPQYNDRDGSRNDIGMFGGHNFIPDGRTTNKPIVLGLDVAPIAVPTGWHRHHRIHRSHREVIIF
jgi:hypothetical protein